MKNFTGLKEVDPQNIESKKYNKRFADCVILTHDNKILVQYRPPEWYRNPDGFNLFGGYVEQDETPDQGVVRELNEELGAVTDIEDMHCIGAVSEDFTSHEEVVYIYFWHDKDNTITGCYEAEARYYETVDSAITEPKLMDYAVWGLMKAKERGFVE